MEEKMLWHRLAKTSHPMIYESNIPNRIMCIWKAFKSIPVFISYTTINLSPCVWWICWACMLVCVCAIGECNRKRMVTGATEELKAFQGGKMNPTFTKSEQHKFVKCGWRCRASFFHVSLSLSIYPPRACFYFASMLKSEHNWHQFPCSQYQMVSHSSCAHMHNMS